MDTSSDISDGISEITNKESGTSPMLLNNTLSYCKVLQFQPKVLVTIFHQVHLMQFHFIKIQKKLCLDLSECILLANQENP